MESWNDAVRLQGQLLIVKDGQALERENLVFRHNKANRKKYLMYWKESIYSKHIMGLQTRKHIK